MEMSVRGGYDLDVADADIEPALCCSIDQHRDRNILTPPLLLLPPELILKIFAYVIDLEGDDDRYQHAPSMLVVTAICHQLREIGIASPQLWDTVDLTDPPIAELFLERCKYDPHTLTKFPSASESGSMYPYRNPRRDILWEKLEGRTFNRLRSIVFAGSQREFLRVAGVLQRAPNVSNLDVRNFWDRPGQELPWPINDPIPNLSTLRLLKFSISWTSPLIRNLTLLILDFVPPKVPSERTSIEMFLSALANCPNLETLNLANAGPDPLNGLQDNCDIVVQLPKLTGLVLEFHEPHTVGYILSHIGYPESTKLGVYVPVDVYTDLSETISQVIPYRNAQAIRHLCKSTTLAICPDDNPHFTTDNLLILFQDPDIHYGPRRGSHALTLLAYKIVEVVERSTITSLKMAAQRSGPPDGMWEELLHGLPRLERICYYLKERGGNRYPDTFISAFSQPCVEGPVCPCLQDLELPWVVLARTASATVLKRALTERDLCGKRLKRIGLSDDTTEVGDMLVLEPFRDLVDEAR